MFPVSVEQIKEVRNGKNTDILRNQDIAGHYPEECAFSIIYGDSYETMDLIANSPDEANIWVTGLTCLVSGKDRKTGGKGPTHMYIIRTRVCVNVSVVVWCSACCRLHLL